MSVAAGCIHFKSISLFCLSWCLREKHVFTSWEQNIQAKVHTDSTSAALYLPWRTMRTSQTEDRQPLCLWAAWTLNTPVKYSSGLWLISLQSPDQEDQDFFFSLLFFVYVASMCCVCCCHWIQSEWGLSRCCTEGHTHSKGMCQDWVSPGYASHTAMQTQLTRSVNSIRKLNKVSMSRKNSAMHKQAGWEKVQIDKRSYGNYHSVKKSTQLDRTV